MNGVSATTGRPIDDDAHLRQSMATILTTPIGSRVMRREFGSLLPELIDQPVNRLTVLRLYAAIAQALTRWEPRLQLRKVGVCAGAAEGGIVVELEGVRTDQARRSEYTRFTLPLRAGVGGAVSLAV